MKRRTLILAIAAILVAGTSLQVHAHEGMIHVVGVVTALRDKSVTVETTDKKSVKVELADTTTYAKERKRAARTDLKVGDRVVIHAVNINDSLQARTVEFNETKH